MAWKAAVLAGCIAPLSGCILFERTAHNVKNEAVLLSEEVEMRSRLREEGERLWDDIQSQYPPHTFTDEFIDGFLDGYVDYLDFGGDATVPVMPPTKYRTTKYLSPEGHAKIRDYFAGFKYGIEVACASGQREYLTVPVIMPDGSNAPHVQLNRGTPKGRPPKPEKKKFQSLPPEQAPPPRLVGDATNLPNNPAEKPSVPSGASPVPPIPGMSSFAPKSETPALPLFQDTRPTPKPQPVSVPVPALSPVPQAVPVPVPTNTVMRESRSTLPAVPALPTAPPAQAGTATPTSVPSSALPSVPAVPTLPPTPTSSLAPATNPILVTPVAATNSPAPSTTQAKPLDPADLLPIRAPVDAPPPVVRPLPEINLR